jgi:hypothetical protein
VKWWSKGEVAGEVEGEVRGEVVSRRSTSAGRSSVGQTGRGSRLLPGFRLLIRKKVSCARAVKSGTCLKLPFVFDQISNLVWVSHTSVARIQDSSRYSRLRYVHTSSQGDFLAMEAPRVPKRMEAPRILNHPAILSSPVTGKLTRSEGKGESKQVLHPKYRNIHYSTVG